MKTLVVAAAVATAAARFFVPSHPLSGAGSYEAIAHLFVGGLLGAGIDKDRRWCWWAAAALSAVELAAFALSQVRCWIPS